MSRKGSAFERDISILLSLWWTKGLGKKPRDDVFWRSTTSGARATTRSKKGKKTAGHYGDICATDPIGNPFLDVFTVELKNGYSSKTIVELLDQPVNAPKPSQYEQWFTKLEKSARDAGSVGWLFLHHRFRRETMCFLPFDLWYDLRSHVRRNEYPPSSCLIHHPVLKKITGLPLAQFLLNTHPADIKRLSKEWS